MAVDCQYYYLVGGNKTRTQYRILQIDRSRQDELKLVEDPVMYSYDACMLRIRQLEALHLSEGGLVRKARYAALLGMNAMSLFTMVTVLFLLLCMSPSTSPILLVWLLTCNIGIVYFGFPPNDVAHLQVLSSFSPPIILCLWRTLLWSEQLPVTTSTL